MKSPSLLRPDRKKVLLVDDSNKAIYPLDTIFRSLDCETLISQSAQSAAQCIVSQAPDFIVLDWCMPDDNGGEAIARAQNNLLQKKNQPLQKIIPVVTFSAKKPCQIQHPKCTHFGFIDHWQKPMSFRELTWNAAKLLSLSPLPEPDL